MDWLALTESTSTIKEWIVGLAFAEFHARRWVAIIQKQVEDIILAAFAAQYNKCQIRRQCTVVR